MEERKAEASVEEGRNVPRMANNSPLRRSTIQPLFVDHILDKVFEFIMKPYLKKVESSSLGNQPSDPTLEIANDLKSFRLVCKFWNERATLISHNANIFAARLGDQGEGNFSPDLSISHFLEKRRLNITIPVQRYTLNGSVFGKMNFQLLHDFAEVCLPDAVQLKLQAEDFSQFQFRVNSIRPRLNLTKLKELLVFSQRLDNPSRYENGNTFPSFLKAVLESAGSLEKLELNIRNSFLENPDSDSEHVAQQLVQLLPLSVKNLKLAISPLKCTQLRTMIERKVALEKLYFCYGYCETPRQPPALPDFLQYQSSTLEDLAIEVREYPFSRPLFICPTFSEMSKLKRLHLMALPCGVPIFFWEIFPQLEVLNLEDFRCYPRFSKVAQCMRLLSYQGRYLPDRAITAPLIERVSAIFPNLKKLRLLYTHDPAESFRTIFVCLPHLEELSVTFKLPNERRDPVVDLDSVLSGVLEPRCKQIKKLDYFTYANFDTFRRRAGNEMAPSILNMTKLKKLELLHYGKTVLTDFSAHYLFLRMSSLNEIRINRLRFDMRLQYANIVMSEKFKVFEANWE